MKIFEVLLLCFLLINTVIAFKISHDASRLNHKITNELAFEIDNKIMRCTQIITNEGTLNSIKRKERGE